MGLARIECKTVTKPHRTFTLHKAWFDKVFEEAGPGEIPMVIMSFDNQRDYACIELHLLPELVQQFYERGNEREGL